MDSREIIRRLRQAGFEKVRQSGSHIRMAHPDGRKVTIPHPYKEIKKGTLAAIRRQAGEEL